VEPGEIFLHDISGLPPKTKQLTGNALDDSSPRINHESVVWLQSDAVGNTTIMIYNLATAETTSAPVGFLWQESPQSDGSRTVFAKYDGTDREIFIRNLQLNTSDPITHNGREDRYPCISGDYVAWVGGKGEASEIYLSGQNDLPPVIPVHVDINPGSCENPLNVKSKGVLPVAILGAEDFDVTTIDPESIRLIEDVAPLRWVLKDVGTPLEPFLGKERCCGDCDERGTDGVTDLLLHFDRQAIVATLEGLGEVFDENCTVLELRAGLKEEFGGGGVVGDDIVRILKKGE
jgi:hypothetical protein